MSTGGDDSESARQTTGQSTGPSVGARVTYERTDRQTVKRVEVTFSRPSAGDLSLMEEVVRRYEGAPQTGLAPVERVDPSTQTLTFSIGEDSDLRPLSERTARLPATDAAKLLHGLVPALKALHEAGLGAINLSPELIFVNEALDRIALVPALWLQMPDAAGSIDTEGPAPYMAPEFFKSDAPIGQPQADMFALGALLWHQLSGTVRPQGTVNLFSECHPSLPGASDWDALLDGCLRSNPARRFDQFEKALATVEAPQSQPIIHSHSHSSTPSKDPSTTQNQSMSFVTVSAMGGGALIVILFLMWLLGGGDGAETGFANTVIRYEDRTYDDATWKEERAIASVSQAALGSFGPLYDVEGVDSKNYWVGDEAGKIFKVKQGQWEFVGQIAGAQWPRITPLNGDTAFITGQRIHVTDNKFSVISPGGKRGFDLGRVKRVWATPIADDFVLLSTMDYWGKPIAHRYRSGTFTELEPNKEKSAFVHRDDNTPLADLPAGFLVEPSVFQKQRTAYALWAGRDTALKPTIVRFEQGLWVTVEEIDATFDTWRGDPIKDVWFGRSDGTVFTLIVGAAGRIVLHRMGGETVDQSLVGSETPTSLNLIAVWGRSPEKYWVMDSNGTVWERRDNRWRTVVRGLYNEDVIFRGAWAAPDGSVLAITDETLYRLD